MTRSENENEKRKTDLAPLVPNFSLVDLHRQGCGTYVQTQKLQGVLLMSDSVPFSLPSASPQRPPFFLLFSTPALPFLSPFPPPSLLPSPLSSVTDAATLIAHYGAPTGLSSEPRHSIPGYDVRPSSSH